MLDNNGFDLWADGYDRSVALSDEDNSYPFAGYRKVLEFVYDGVRRCRGKRVLDVGVGTAVLSGKLYLDDYEITAVDFSENMLRIAREKLPGARLMRCDFSKGLPAEIQNEKFDAVICTYAIHHLDEDQQVTLISEMKKRLAPGGRIFIGDISFENVRRMEECREAAGDEWDADEHYFTAEDMVNFFCDARYTQISHCAGVLTVEG